MARPFKADHPGSSSTEAMAHEQRGPSMALRLLSAGCVLFLLSAPSASRADAPSLEDVRAGIESHYAAYNDFEFVYRVKAKDQNGDYDDTQNTYRLHIPDEGYPWQYLVVRKPSPDDNTLQIERFRAFNGQETWVYSRSPLREGNWSKCAKAAGYSWDAFLGDYYSQLLVTSIVGLPFTTLSPQAYDDFWKKKKETLHFAGKTELDGREVLILRSNGDGGTEVEYHVLGAPHFMIVRIQITETGSKKTTQLFDVEEIGEEQGVVFPKKGRYFRAPGVPGPNEDASGDYSFNVIEVRHLDKVAQTAWFPEIPPGTAVSDHIAGKTYSVPWSDQQREIMAKQAEAQWSAQQREIIARQADPLLPTRESSTPSRTPRIVGVLAALVLLVIVLYVRLRRRGQSAPR